MNKIHNNNIPPDSIENIMRLPLLTIEQAAILLQVSDRTIRERIKKNEIPYSKIAGFIRIKREELLAL